MDLKSQTLTRLPDFAYKSFGIQESFNVSGKVVESYRFLAQVYSLWATCRWHTHPHPNSGFGDTANRLFQHDLRISWVFYGYLGWWGKGCMRQPVNWTRTALSWVSIRKTGLKLGITSIRRLVVFSNSGNYLDQLMERHISELGRWSYSNCANLRTVIWGFAKVTSCGFHSLRIWWAFWTFWGARIGGSKHNLSRAWAQTGPDLVEMDHVLSSRSELLLPWLIAQPGYHQSIIFCQ